MTIRRDPQVWYVAQTQAKREFRAAAELARQGFDVFLPRYLRRISHARRVTNVAAPLFPGYVFISIAEKQRWRAINGTIGVIQLVMVGDEPAPLASGIVEELIALQDEKGYVPQPGCMRLRRGDPVRVASGSFADALGLFEQVQNRDRVVILLSLLGRKVRVVLDEALIERAA